ncbi:MAG: pectate lyase [Christensenellaceae bacterium]
MKKFFAFLFVVVMLTCCVCACKKPPSDAENSGLNSSDNESASTSLPQSADEKEPTTYEKAIADKPVFDLKIERDKCRSVKDLLGDNYADFLRQGIIAEGQFDLHYAQSVKIESVKTYGDDLVIVNFNSYIDDFNPNDVKIRARNSDWYGLNTKTVSRVETLSYAVGYNAQGKTVVVLKLKTKLNGIRTDGDYYPVSEIAESKQATIITQAENAITWQIPQNGGWDKDYALHISRKRLEGESYITNGPHNYGQPLGTIDNNATYPHIRLIASAFALTGDVKFKESFKLGLEFLKNAQYPSGAFPQFYPLVNNYYALGTFNDNATYGVMTLLEDIFNGRYPFTDLVNEQEKREVKAMYEKGIDYIIKCQIVVDGVKTAWCAQHDPYNYQPKKARSFEPVSISGCESINLIKLLLKQRDNPEATEGALAAIEWFKKAAVKDTAYDNKGVTDSATGNTVYFYPQQGSTLWYRFYEIETMKGIFGDRDGSIHYDVSEISEERRLGYVWASDWATKLLDTYSTYDYYPNRIVVQISSAKSVISGGTMNIGDICDADENLKP